MATFSRSHLFISAACTTDTGLNLSASYTYSNDLLTAIQTPSTTYGFTYGDFDLRTSVSAGSYALAEYTYTNDRNRYLSALDYGNGDSVEYTYDDHGRLVTQTYEDGDSLYHKYDNSGNLASVWDSATARTTYYYYDLTDRMMKYVEKGDDGYSHSVGYEYNKLNNLTQQVETINGVDHTTSYTYDKDNRVETVTTGGVTVTYTYDDLGRVSKQETKNGDTLILTEEFTYTAPEDGKTSSQIAIYDIYSESGYEIRYLYTYDDNGNITKITERNFGSATGYSLETYYEYDSANQLIKERYPMAGYTYQWVYDDAGNILSRTENGTTTVSYGYDEANTGWGDLLTSYNGQAIDSDLLGNITDDGTWEYTWEHGRQLASMSDGTTTWNYTYNGDGLRTKKTNGTTTYTYVYNGSQLTQMTKGTDTLYFTYDASGTPLTLTHNGTTYYYVTNIQGDVVGILNGEGESLVTYRYEASGKQLTLSGTEKDGLGALNPLRYRGYVYDTETGLYYVSSRYYDPEIGRWINADSVIAGVGGSIQGYNMFAYCFNNPVNMDDQTGNWPKWIKNTVKWVAKNIVKPVVKTVQKTLSKVDLTYSTGVNVSGTPSAWIFNGQIGVSMDTKGNVAIQASGGVGITGGDPGISITRYQSVTNAPNIDKLNDAYYQIGGSIAVPIEGVPVAAGGDVMFMPDPELNTGYFGLTRNVGFGTPGKEFHVEWGTTVTLPYTQFNVYEVARSVYIKIMEW